MVKDLGGSTYVNMEGGASLYDRAVFAEAGLAVSFVASDVQSQISRRAEMFGNLSIIDTLMHFGVPEIRGAIS